MSIEQRQKIFCWSCGKSPASCVCGKESHFLKLNPPKEVLPICKLPDELGDPNKLEMRPCCRCNKMWLCTASQWISGTCPHCGASGATGKGGNYDVVVTVSNANLFEPILKNDHSLIKVTAEENKKNFKPEEKKLFDRYLDLLKKATLTSLSQSKHPLEDQDLIEHQ